MGYIRGHIKNSSIYRGVFKTIGPCGNIRWNAQLSSTQKHGRINKIFDTEREAALCIDHIFIRNRLTPVNILKRRK